jgi:cell volume regulation protein A
MDVLAVFLVVSAVLFFGFFAEFLFKRLKIPDVLLLILFGLALGPYGLGFVQPGDIAGVAPIFVAFALLFILYDGGFAIDLATFAKELPKSVQITLYNFVLSSVLVSAILLIVGLDWRLAVLAGFTLGGISSAFTIPVLKQLKVPKQPYSILTLESAFTDVLCIVLALTMMDLILAGTYSMQSIASTIVSLFAIAGLIGIVSGILWIFVLTRVLKKNATNMVTIAFLLLVYVITEHLGGNGAIAALFLGIMLKNSYQLKTLLYEVIHNEPPKDAKNPDKAAKESVTGENEELFYKEIAFLIKTLFFVYIGVLLDFSNWVTVGLGIAIGAVLVFSRLLDIYIARDLPVMDRQLIMWVGARGIAPAVIVQVAIDKGVPNADALSAVVMVVILTTIVISSARVFQYERLVAKEKTV